MRHFTLLQIINESGAETGDKKAYKKVDKCEIVYVSHDHFAGVVRVEKKKKKLCVRTPRHQFSQTNHTFIGSGMWNCENNYSVR